MRCISAATAADMTTVVRQLQAMRVRWASLRCRLLSMLRMLSEVLPPLLLRRRQCMQWSN